MFSEILKHTRKKKKITQSKLAEMVGVDTSSIAKYETGNAKPSLEIIIKIADSLCISIDQLLGRDFNTFDNEGMQLLDLYAQAPAYLQKIAILSLSQGKFDSLKPKSKIFYIDYYADYPVSAGTGSYVEESQREILTLHKSPPKGSCFVNRISGDSMEPIFFDGDKVFVSPDPASEGDIGIFIYENDAYIKKAGRGRLLSINKKYPDVKILNPDSLFCVGTVLGKCDDSYF